ncbi:MAG: PilZ domain-containing protein [Gammaproteobacteria bacterium]
MTENQRRYPRHEIKVNVEMSFLEENSRIFKTRDISEGGMFLLVDSPASYPIGEMVHVHYLDPLREEADTFKDAIIVRVADDGIGISYVELEAY